MDQQKPTQVTGYVTWESNKDAPTKAPLTGKDVTEQVNRVRKSSKSARVSGRRSRKSDTAFRTISEVAELLDVQQHVLRFWETKFSQVRPLKRGGGRRYYRPEDITLLQRIHHLLYTEGYTIKGVQKLLKEQGKKAVIEAANVPEAVAVEAVEAASATVEADIVREGLSQSQRSLLESTLDELKSLRKLVS